MIDCYDQICRTELLPEPRAGKQAGLTIVELMVSIALGLLVVMAATALLVSSKSGYTAQDEASRVQETGRYALESIARAIRQAGYQDLDRDGVPFLTANESSANISGLDAHSLNESPFGLESPLSSSVHGSDVLAVRFFGVGSGQDGDGTILNCAGFSVPAPASNATVDDDRGWSIFYVANGEGGEPQLRCKYRSKTDKNSWKVEAIARGVESFQVLYGFDTDADGMPNQFLTASAINALDGSLTFAGADDTEKNADKNRKTNWKKVVAVKVALLVRGSENGQADSKATQYDLFGTDYGDAQGAVDAGTRIKISDFSTAVRYRIRKVFAITIQLRSKTAGGAP